jgi:hypothetical protein
MLSLIIYYLSKNLNRKTSSEIVLCAFLLLPTMLITGVMQMPTTEPFFSMLLIQWFGLLILEKSLKNKIALPP